jgi:uridine phosphorylase
MEREDAEGGGAEPEERDGDEKQYHLEVSSGEVADTVLLPGNPERIPKVTDVWDSHEVVGDHREYRTVTGEYEGVDVSATSTGIGSPSAAIAVEELASVGADTLVRVGSCGAIQPEVSVGDLVISDGAVRLEGTSGEYVTETYPAVADYEVVTALVTAAERLGYDYHVGTTATTDSFYVGQGREGYDGFLPERGKKVLEEMRGAGGLNFEMEASAIMTAAGVYGLRAGSVCTVYADRNGEEFSVEGEKRASEVGSLAAVILSRMDETKGEEGSWTADRFLSR